MCELDNVIRDSPVVVHRARYAYLSVFDVPQDSCHFLICCQGEDRTVVTREDLVGRVNHREFRGWFRLLEFKISVPFEGKGFLAKITNSLAESGLNVLVVSTFSRDYVLLHEEDVTLGCNTLREVGFAIELE